MKVDVLKEIPLEELIGLVRTVPLMNKDKEAPKVKREIKKTAKAIKKELKD